MTLSFHNPHFDFSSTFGRTYVMIGFPSLSNPNPIGAGGEYQHSDRATFPSLFLIET